MNMKNSDLHLNLDKASLLTKLRKTGTTLERYSTIIFIVIVVSLYGYLIIQINNSVTREPTESEVSGELSTVKRLKIDQDAIEKIKSLEDQNIEVQSLFQEARDNPFSE